MEPVAYLCLAFLLPAVAGQGRCPEADEIRPCTCAGHDPDGGFHESDLDCSRARTSEEISSAFRTGSWPTTRFWEFRLEDNEDVKKLPKGVLGLVSFQAIRIDNTNVETVHPSAILQSNDRLLVLEIQNSRLKAFPSHILPQLPNLLTLNLRNNSLTVLPAVESFNLRVLHLPFNNITRVEEDGWATPNLRVLDVGSNLKGKPHDFLYLYDLAKTTASSNLGPTLSTGLLQFNSLTLKTVGLSENKIAIIEPDAITGLTPDTEVFLNGNNISKLPEEVFRPMLELLSQGTGALHLQENPIECDCTLDWLVSDSTILKSVRGTCVDGTDFGSLTLNCRTCPHECVSREEASSCEPGTVITTNVDNCQSSELCCQRTAPEASTTSSPAPAVVVECKTDYPRIENAEESFEGWTGESPAPDGGQVLFTCKQGFTDGSATHMATCSSSTKDAWSATFKEDERTTLCPPSSLSPETPKLIGGLAWRIKLLGLNSPSGVASTTYSDCRLTEKGREYIGTKDKTETGKECLRWDSMPHGIPKDFSSIEDYEGHFPNRDSWSQENFCRNPSGKERPWCFVSDPEIMWEYCDIPMCDDKDPPECKVTQQGGEYIGRKNVTLSGLPCRPWASSALHPEAFADADAIDGQHNFCRNPDGKVAPWCYYAVTIHGDGDGDDSGWEFCDVHFCDIQPSDQYLQPHEGETEQHVYPECRLSERGKEYVGKASKTETGTPCLRWDSQPYGMPWDFFNQTIPYEKHFLGASATPHENYCRNPGLHRRRPWCFVSDPHVKWEYCDIPLCDDKTPPECKQTELGGEYAGRLNVTLSGTPCQRWLTLDPKNRGVWDFLSQFPDGLDGSHNFCRNADRGFGPWCYTASALQWEYCDVPFCPSAEGERCRVRVSGKCVDPQECKRTKNGIEYIGTLNTTASGYPCQAWMSRRPNWHEMGYRTIAQFPDELYPSHNFCRNPDSTDDGPWCYIGSGRNPRWEYCEVPMC
ncbi:unnamed protein product [Darwinula stevensoni]|uniref:Kringle domain-containing protein n=1 Tax=Darwinula stevensoni TaxID=69355 RepID=A0A7R8X8B9_9CRUS|nr:unnamed protein product [Darwinula stevensoni]CAG0884308.1 unnamed protein product [Darwinula stevensoni]